MRFAEWWNSAKRRECERQDRERFEERMARRADPASRHEPKRDTVPRTRLTVSQIDERTAIAVESAIEHERASQLQLFRLLSEETFEVLERMRDRIGELRAEKAELKAGLAELRAAFFTEKADKAAAKAEEKSAPVDLPRLPLHYRTHMN